MPLPLFARLYRKLHPHSAAERREFLKQTAAMGAGLLLSNQVALGQAKKQKRVVIVGGGFSGLACAHELKSAGYHVTVIEARARVGGRVLSFKDFVEGKNVEGGGELIGSNHPTWVAYKEKFELNFIDVSEEEDLNNPVYFDGKILDFEEVGKMYEAMEEATGKLNEVAAEIDAEEPWKSPKAAELDKQSLADWIKTHELSDTARKLMNIQVASDNAVANDKASYLAMLVQVKGGGLEKYWSDSEVFRCKEGNQTLAFRLSEAIGVDNIRLKLPVNEIKYDADKVVVTCADGRTLECDDVILAIPPSTWHKIKFSPGLPADLKPQMGTAVKYLTSVKKRFWLEDELSQYAISDQLISQTWELTDAQPTEPPNAGLIGFSGGPQALECLKLKGDERDAAYAAEFEKLYPKFKENFVKSRMMDWPNDPFTMAGYSFPAPGQITSMGPMLHKGLGRLHFAGEHTCYKFVGYMEGALNSGASLAKRLAVRDGVVKG